jgi:hypothetical protein
MQAACATQVVEKIDDVDEVKNVDFRLVEWLCNPTEKPVRATIVEYPAEKQIFIDISPSQADEWNFFARLIDAHEHWLREIRRKHPKELRRCYVAAEAKDRVRVIGTCLLELCRQHKLLPLTPDIKKYVRRKADGFSKRTQRHVTTTIATSRANIWAERRKASCPSMQELRTWNPLEVEDYQERTTLEQSIIKWRTPPQRQTLPQLTAQELRTWEPLEIDDYQERTTLEQSRIPFCPPPQNRPVKHLGLCAAFADLASVVKSGENARVSDYGHYTEATRSKDGNTIVLTSKFGLQKTLTRTTVQRAEQFTTTVMAKYSHPVRFTGRDGVVTYGDTEQETTVRFDQNEESTVEDAGRSGVGEAAREMLSAIAPETTLLTAHEQKRRAERGDQREIPIAPTVPNRIRVKTAGNKYEPNSCVGILTPTAWRSILYHKVRINPREQTFTIEEKTYPISQFRVSENPSTIAEWVGVQGRLAWPYIAAIAKRVAYLQRASPDRNTFDTILTERLPWLLANIDMTVPAAQLVPFAC